MATMKTKWRSIESLTSPSHSLWQVSQPKLILVVPVVVVVIVVAVFVAWCFGLNSVVIRYTSGCSCRKKTVCCVASRRTSIFSHTNSWKSPGPIRGHLKTKQTPSDIQAVSVLSSSDSSHAEADFRLIGSSHSST